MELDPASAAARAPQFILSGRGLCAGAVVVVADSQHITLTAPAGCPGGPVTIAPVSDRGQARTVTVRAGQTGQWSWPAVRLTPTPDLALGATTYPTSRCRPG